MEPNERAADASTASSELDDSSATSSARDVLAEAIQTPMSESSSASIHAEHSPAAQDRTPLAVSKYQQVLDGFFAANSLAWLAIVHALGMLICAVLLAVRLRSLHRRKQLMSRPESRFEAMYRETAVELEVRRLPELLVSPVTIVRRCSTWQTSAIVADPELELRLVWRPTRCRWQHASVALWTSGWLGNRG